ncbi:glycosyltransferase family 25 protein [Zoogloea sp.]|uniref:glycosyltransferase family 25 protein n=1 Tax=Zoogloea sp. TaxID=49181 RepID=UPI0035B00AF4
MKIFIVNLERAADRRAAILRHLGELGLEAEILPAVEGVKVDRATLGPGAEPRLSNGEVGCYLSHVRFWQLVVERRLPHAIVLEDDVVCSPSLLRVARDAAALMPPFDAVRLSALQPIRGIPVATLSGGEKLILPTKHPSGTQGYLVSLDGARRLLAALSVPRSPIDDTLDRYWKYGLCVPVVAPSVVVEDASIASGIGARFGSTAPDSVAHRVTRHFARVVEAERRKLSVFLMARRVKAQLQGRR